ncbi:MAG: hypothetical protein KF813_00455 [Trueperaceae bacterium]|nr:hypothetical protein [Trueperaceae bacterium]
MTFAFAQAAAQGAWGDYPELVVTVTEQSVSAPASLPAGFYRLVIDDRTELRPEVFFLRIGEGSTNEEVHTAFHAVETAGSEGGNVGAALVNLRSIAALVGGRSTPDSVIIELKEGEHSLATSLKDAAGNSVTSTIMVTANAAAPNAPTADVRVEMADFAFALPATVAAGQQTWQVVNSGNQIHHLILMRLNDGVTFDDLMAFMGAGGPPSGPPPFQMAITTDLLTNSESNFFLVDLAEGNYVAICFLPDEDSGAPHFALGMMQEFSVPGN